MPHENPRLVRIPGGQEIEIISDKFVIGRSLSCDYVLDNIFVSRNHFVLEKSKNVWNLRDSSCNGTLLNEVNVHKTTQELTHGDVISLDRTELKFKFVIRKNELPMTPEPTKFQLKRTKVQRNEVIVIDESDSSPELIKTNRRKRLKPEAKKLNFDAELIEEELQCSICSELFIEAVTLFCSHTFCKHCITEWKKRNEECPLCRNVITGMVSSLITNSLIEKHIDKMGLEYKEHRARIIEFRKVNIT